ncbi:phosphoribosyltransferase [Fodinibius sediminis]|uniref:Phosphoribosyltransferase domain-containing protein n=1 Tax=Fodinibius sediminis TaxID=1214077 RepID=A0A521CG88_9BACT|nr:phosphoribosyltransferase [Fodinibius sediminis]SMO58453.1 hypothetical protein SAMN06265218_10636 [Fodinibius sediminis]
MKENFTASLVSLQEVYRTTSELARNIMEASVTADIIIAIARGGMLPGRLLCDFLNVDRLSSLQIKHYSSGAHQMEQAEIIDPVRVDLKGKKVLLVDDVNDSGKTMQLAVNHVQSFHPSELNTAVLHQKEGSSYTVDFVGRKQERWEWLIYQWAATEDILEFLKRDDMLQADTAEARRHLAKKYELNVDKALVETVMKMKGNYF